MKYGIFLRLPGPLRRLYGDVAYHRMHLERRMQLHKLRRQGDPVATGEAGWYGVISLEPAILLIYYWHGSYVMIPSMRRLYESLGDDRLFLFVQTSWWMGAPRSVKEVAGYDRAHRRNFPHHELFYLCNTAEETERFAAAGLNAHFVNENCMTDDKIFRPLKAALTERPLDAVYNARTEPYKRHELCDKIASLGLINAGNPIRTQADGDQPAHPQLARRHLFNEPPGQPYRMLTPEQTNAALNQCRVGLALSAEEGSMRANIEYLLAGLPVVSTPSRGGRDVFFDRDTALIVEPTADAVAQGVRTMVERRIDPMLIRARTMKKVRAHRQYFLGLVQKIFDDASYCRRDQPDWATFFRPAITQLGMVHAPVIEAFRQVRAGKVDSVDALRSIQQAVGEHR